jgi:N-acetylglucosaminyldiphosphoundecaprenol N-acetyl-beta-D-mannosaminyltransferase
MRAKVSENEVIQSHYNVLGTNVSITNLRKSVALIEEWSIAREARTVCFRDVHGIVKALDDPELASAHRGASLVAPDGMPIVWIGRLKGHVLGRTYGPDVMAAVMARSVEVGLSHYLYGGKEGVAEKLKTNMTALYGSINFAGVETPPFHDLDAGELLELANRIKASGATTLWIGISSPRQEKLMARLTQHLNLPILAVGAAFDFHSDTVRQAPRWLRNIGFEWAFRLASEPKRLASRYLTSIPKFLYLILKSEFRNCFAESANPNFKKK